MNIETLGQTAYEGYYASTGGRTFDGRPMPLWHELPITIQRAWQTGAERVRRETLADVIDALRKVHAEMGL